MPMRTPFTPALPTVMWLCPVAMTVPGSSNTNRAGESAVVTLGVTAPRALISTRTSSAAPRTTFTRCSSLRWLDPCDAGVSAADAASPSTSNGRITLSNCFRISLLSPTRGFGRVSFLNSIFQCSGFPGGTAVPLYRRRRDSLNHFAREWLTQLVLHRFLEHHRVPGDFHHEPVEHRIVLVQEISFVQAVGHYRDEAGFRLHHASYIDLSDIEAFLSGGAT